jgi:type IX secretion system PorP/SprF family membrane protein
MNKKLMLSLALLLSCFENLFAQQDPLYSQYINNPLVINPGYAGLTNNLNTAVSYRQQWAGLEGSPQTFNFNGHISLLKNTMGAGLIVLSDRIGSNIVNEALAIYSYRIKLDREKTLSFGLQTGIANYQFNNTNLNAQDVTDQLFQDQTSETLPQFGAGVILTSDKFFFGLSMPRMLASQLKNGGLQETLYNQHFYATGSYLFLLNERIRFRPSALVKQVKGAPLSVDVNAAFILYENYQIGMLARNVNAFGVFGQILWKDKYRLGYVFEVPTGSSVGTNFTTHEITLGIRFNALPFHSNSSIFSF